MVNEFSEYARAPSLNLSSVDINQLVQDVLELYEPDKIKIKLRLEKDIAEVLGDATMLRQVLHNLLQNAQDALDKTPKATIQVNTFQHGDEVCLSVSDNGTGFPLEILSSAFEPYMTTKQHGTGLGLAIVKKIVEEHKGTINVENIQLDKDVLGGAIVTVCLPSNNEPSKAKTSKADES
jgi:nitrogen fixation/metabolism regulation signal transduction histidine kinase